MHAWGQKLLEPIEGIQGVCAGLTLAEPGCPGTGGARSGLATHEDRFQKLHAPRALQSSLLVKDSGPCHLNERHNACRNFWL